jgi:hypothetical protein
MFGHQHVRIYPDLMPIPNLFQNCFDGIFEGGFFKKRTPVVATEGDEVKSLGLLEPLQTGRHNSILDLNRPLIAIKLR